MAVLPSRPCAPFVLLCTAIVAVAGAGKLRADEPGSAGSANTAGVLVDSRLKWHTEQARQEAAGWEVALIAPPRASNAAVSRIGDADLVLNQLRPELITDYEALRNATRNLAETSRTQRETIQKEWAAVYRERIAFRTYTDKQQAAYKFDFDTGAQPTFQPTLFDAGVVVWSLLVFVIAIRLGRHVRRVAIRKVERAAAAVALVGLFGVSGCSGGATDTRPWTVREEATLAEETKAFAEKATAATAEADRKWAEGVDGWARLVKMPGAQGETVEGVLRRGEEEARNWLRAAAIDAYLAARLSKEAEEQRGQMAADRAKLAELTNGAKLRVVIFAVGRCVGVALLFGLAVAPYWRARRQEAAQVKTDAKKCPRCFSDKLVVEKSGAIPDTTDEEEEEEDERPRYRGKKAKAKPKAKTKTDEAQETGYVECKACSFRFLRSYQKVRRLCFPVVGVRSSGKTHMLATGYDRVRKRTAPTVAVVQPAPSLGDVRFEEYIDLILNLKREAGGTVHDMPDPVMLHVRDSDPAGPNTALVNLFDYSGELVNQSIDRDRLKKQAVRMDGFMLFLDPTQLYGDGIKVTLDRQLAALNEFMADMREIRGVPVGQVIPVPVAVCIPKFDLLLTENPIEGQSVPYIRRLLSEMNPSPKKTTLETLQDRSELVEEMLELMFRGVDVRGLVESYFGPQVMFFPVSSVSLFENELGERDLSKRTIAPFGVTEPFLWLLHMHGYEMFA